MVYNHSMPSRTGAIHVATIPHRHGDKLYETHLLRRSYRHGDKVLHQTLGNISHLPPHVIEMIRESLRGRMYVPVDDNFEAVRSRPFGHVAAVLGVLRKLGLDRLISSTRDRKRDLVVAMVVARLLKPGSKLATARQLSAEAGLTCLGEALSLGRVNEKELYAALDWLVARQQRIENKLARRHLSEGSLLLYDVTSSYYTGKQCPLAKLGHCRDKLRGVPQIVCGLLCNQEGVPVSVQVFDGNTGDPTTFTAQLQKVRERFGLRKIVWVGDRGMITEARIRDDLKGLEGVDWITALRGPSIKALVEQKTIQASLFDERDLAAVTSADFPNERLIVCRNPALAAERTRKRQELLAATEKVLQGIVNATQRARNPLRGKDKIALRVGKVRHQYKMAKHFKLTITEQSFAYERDAEKIRSEAALDGLYVIRTSVKADRLGDEETVSTYKGLSVVEWAFRSMKKILLRLSPIFLRLPNHVRGHVFACMLSYYVEWHMRKALAPLLFAEEDKAVADALRDSVVAPARRSPKALRKAKNKQTDDGQPVHSLSTIFDNLATIVSSRMQVTGPAASSSVEFDLVTTPSPYQRQVFDLLQVPIASLSGVPRGG